ncbi:MAG: hypothetical protein IJU76_07280 [Desulfovibrionaceae bacterium]|nr:hypothetical protein [Desulfovibrionaceae bacterium]
MAIRDGRRVGWPWFLVTALLIVLLAACAYEWLNRKEQEEAALQKRISAEEAQVLALTQRIQDLNSLLTRTPCEAQARWTMP